MAGAYPFPLLVELEENNIPRLKNKLVKYFQSKKSNGGDCEVDYENGSSTATLRFRTEEGKFDPMSDTVLHFTLLLNQVMLPRLLSFYFLTVNNFFFLTDQQNVLRKETHEIRLDQGVLKMTVRLPTEKKRTQVNK